MKSLKDQLRHPSKISILFLSIAVVLFALRAALPTIVKRYANRQLAQLKDYEGHIGDVDISLIRGAYRIENLTLLKRGGKVPVPFIAVREIDLSIEWMALFHGAVVAEMELTEPKLNFVDGPTPEKSQKSIDSSWQEVVDKLIPLKINRLALWGGEVHFQNLASKPPVDIHLKELAGEALNLSNARDVKAVLPSTLHLRGKAMGEAPFRIDMKLNALKEPMDFDLDADLKGLTLAKLNSFMKAYAGVDVETGVFTLASELAAKNGALTGYVKPTIKNLTVVDFAKDVKQGPFALIWQGLTGTLGDLLQKDDKQATKIPVQGSIKNPKVNAMAAIGSALGHAFGHPLDPGVENSVDIHSAEAAAQKAPPAE